MECGGDACGWIWLLRLQRGSLAEWLGDCPNSFMCNLLLSRRTLLQTRAAAACHPYCDTCTSDCRMLKWCLLNHLSIITQTTKPAAHTLMAATGTRMAAAAETAKGIAAGAALERSGRRCFFRHGAGFFLQSNCYFVNQKLIWIGLRV